MCGNMVRWVFKGLTREPQPDKSVYPYNEFKHTHTIFYFMKRLKTLLPLLFIAFFGVAMAACSDDDNDKDLIITSSNLPEVSRTFISTYFPNATVVKAIKDKDEYEVILSDKTEIDFYTSGEWKDVDAPAGQALPTGFYPADIDLYLAYNLEGVGINEISKDKHGYDVETVTGLDIRFDYDGKYINTDID